MDRPLKILPGAVRIVSARTGAGIQPFRDVNPAGLSTRMGRLLTGELSVRRPIPRKSEANFPVGRMSPGEVRCIMLADPKK